MSLFRRRPSPPVTSVLSAPVAPRAILRLSRQALDVLDSAASETLALPLEPLPGTDAEFAALMDACDAAAEQVRGTGSHVVSLVLPAHLLPVVRALLPRVAELVGPEELRLRTTHGPEQYASAQVELAAALDDAVVG